MFFNCPKFQCNPVTAVVIHRYVAIRAANSTFCILLMVTNVLWKRTGQQDAILSLIFTKVN